MLKTHLVVDFKAQSTKEVKKPQEEDFTSSYWRSNTTSGNWFVILAAFKRAGSVHPSTSALQ